MNEGERKENPAISDDLFDGDVIDTDVFDF